MARQASGYLGLHPVRTQAHDFLEHHLAFTRVLGGSQLGLEFGHFSLAVPATVQLGATFTAQQRFVANASHELRTPLAVMRTEVDVTLSDPDVDAAELRRMAEAMAGS